MAGGGAVARVTPALGVDVGRGRPGQRGVVTETESGMETKWVAGAKVEYSICTESSERNFRSFFSKWQVSSGSLENNFNEIENKFDCQGLWKFVGYQSAWRHLKECLEFCLVEVGS